MVFGAKPQKFPNCNIDQIKYGVWGGAPKKPLAILANYLKMYSLV
jgi:hypothetical protein